MITSDADAVTVQTSAIKGLYNVMADVTRRLQPRQKSGPVVIITEHPQETCAIARRFWSRMIQRLLAQRLHGEHTGTIADISRQIADMQSYRFTTELPYLEPRSNVFIMHPKDIGEMFPACRSFFVLTDIPFDQKWNAFSYLTPDSLVVEYVSH